MGNGSMSESSLNYSNIGLYDKLIQNETTKSEQLTTLLKIREKALLDRTKGQIAWLQVQKERYKAQGLVAQIATIKKKQRAILLKMDKEREDIKRLLQSSSTTLSTESSKRHHGSSPHSKRIARRSHNDTVKSLPDTLKSAPPTLPVLQLAKPSRSAGSAHHHKEGLTGVAATRSAPILRANYELKSTASLEQLLERREADLRKRREHVERLMQWHRRLDEEEAEVMQMEHVLLNYNSTHTTEQLHPTSEGSLIQEASERSVHQRQKMERRIKEIDKSLHELSNISGQSPSFQKDESDTTEVGVDFVPISGNKLNKLWRRLTSQHIEKFEPGRRYKLCKSDLERLYEEAKKAVLKDFAQDEERITTELLERSASNLSCSNSQSNLSKEASSNKMVVPRLNLNCSSGQSEQDEESVAEASAHSLSQGNYSPSAAEDDFNMRAGSQVNSIPSDENSDVQRNENLEKFMELPQRNVEQKSELHRSFSDTQLANFPQSIVQSTNATSQGDISTNIHSNKKSLEKSDIVDCKTEESCNHYSPSGDTLQSVQSIKSYSQSFSSSTESSCKEIATNIPTDEQSSGKLASAEDSAGEPIYLTIKSTNPTGEVTKQQPILPHSNQTDEGSESDHSYAEDEAKSPTLTNEDIDENLQTPDAKTNQNSVDISTHPSATDVTLCNREFETEADSKAREISTKLKAISAAVSQLSRANSLHITNNRNIPKASQSSGVPTEPSVEEPNLSGDVSYASTFEKVGLDLQSLSSGTLSGANAIKTQSSEQREDREESETTVIPSISGEQRHSQSFTSTKNIFFEQYEPDFESISNETQLEDLSLPHFETTLDSSQEGEHSNPDTVDAEDTLIEEKVENEENTLPTLPPPPPPPPPPSASAAVGSTLNSSNNSGAQLMPDIINELETRRQQILLETEQARQYEQVTAVPYMYVREIPNKPPPPYVPPAHGSPMTTIFPSEERIKDITYRRTHELYCELLKTDYTNEKGEKLPSVMEEKITNIYERIILDICREYLEEHQDVLTQGDPTNFRSQLAFFNPPDRLRCIQESVYKEIRRCLAMDKTSPKRTQVYSVYGQRAKRDHIGKVIIQEMYDEDENWCNFQSEEQDVLELIIEEMVNNNIRDVAKETLLEEGGTIEETENESGSEKANDKSEMQAGEEGDVASTTAGAEIQLETQQQPQGTSADNVVKDVETK